MSNGYKLYMRFTLDRTHAHTGMYTALILTTRSLTITINSVRISNV